MVVTRPTESVVPSLSPRAPGIAGEESQKGGQAVIGARRKAMSDGTGLTAQQKVSLLKWSMMVATVVWTLVYRLGLESSALTEFRYVNF